MNILVTGASGMLGRSVMRALNGHRVVGTAYTRPGPGLTVLDLRDEAAVAALISREQPDLIVHTAAERRPDVSEKDPEGTIELNVSASGRLAGLAARHGAALIHLSTDYVFDGKKPPYRPGDDTNPLNLYGRSKRDGEEAVLNASGRVAVLRVPVLYGQVEHLDESAVTVMAGALLKPHDQPPAMDHWAIRYPTLVDDVAVVIRQMIDQSGEGNPFTGIFHWSANEAMTKYDIAVLIAELWGVDQAFVPVTGAGGGTPRPRDCHLDSTLLEARGIGRRSPFRAALETALEPFKP